MQRVIGLDIGSYSIKAVEIINTFKSYEIVNFYENVIPHLEGVPMDAVAPSCMEQLFRENDLLADRIVTAMPGQFISSRIINLPFSDPRRIETAVFAEVEDAVPFNMDEMIVDHQVLGSTEGRTVTLAVMTRKAFLKNFLELLQRIQIDPKLVDVDSLAFYNLSSYMPNEPNQCFAMVDIGHEKTSMCIIRNDVLQLFRSINLGGRYVTEFLARDLEISFQDAQRVKHKVSRVFCASDPLEEVAAEDRMVVERTTIAANAIIKELGRTLYSFKSWEQEPLSKIYISGGTSKIANLDRMIEDQLEVETVRCHLEATDLALSDHLGQHMESIPQSVAIGLRTVTSVRKQSQINLRTGEFAYVQNYEAILGSVGKMAKVAAVAFLLLSVSYGFKYFVYRKHINKIQEQYKKEYTAIFPDQKRKIRKMSNFTRLRRDAQRKLNAKLNDMKQSVDLFKQENAGSGALILLKEISQSIPKDVKLDVTLYQFNNAENGEGQVLIRAETEGYGIQSKVMDAIKKVPSLSDVTEKQSGLKIGTKDKIVEFTVQAKYVPSASKLKG